MHSSKTQKINAVADFAASIYRSHDVEDIAIDTGETRERAVLRIASDSILQTQSPGVLGPALRAMLEAMDHEYAKILMRIDKIVAESNDGDLRFDNENPPVTL